MRIRRLQLSYPLDLAGTLAPLRTGTADPTVRLAPREAWWAVRTPDSAGTLHLVCTPPTVVAAAWGPGAAWLLDTAPELLGAGDHPEGFRPAHPLLERLHRRSPGLRLCRSHCVVDALQRAVVEQKVTSIEAKRAWRRIVVRFGEPAPGPGRLLLPPAPELLAQQPYFRFHPLGLERRRAETLRRVCVHAARLGDVSTLDPGEATRRLLAVNGVGPWTAALVVRTALGDADAVEVGDYHIPNLVAWNLAGEPRADDARMLELLEPYRGHRGRVVRLLCLSGRWAPRFGPRRPLRRLEAI
ncbi:MAG: DNA-3-methyladenine glycosylase 2 family protein [Actinomycetota bacterium]|nr:DNA-3-methyladenine glycosylase 2 family protein [Actinomycetota bacterium]